MSDVIEIDHAVVTVNDLALTIHFYREILGSIVGRAEAERLTMLTTDELIRAAHLRQRAAGYESQAERVTRLPAPHGSVTVGDAVIPFFLYHEHVQEPPPEQLRGTPRIALGITEEQMDRAPDILRQHRVHFEGPISYTAPCPSSRSLYLKDPSGNFIELCCPRTSEA
jgi:catechol-2,3-dioxygenase